MTDPKLRFRREWDEMTDTQQEIIDLRAKNPDLTSIEIAEKAGVTASYVNGADREAQDIIEQRREELGVTDELDKFAEEAESPGQESNANGQEITMNQGLDQLLTDEVQTWKDRPVKNQLTEDQVQAIEEFNGSDLEKRIIRAKLRNPDINHRDLAEMIDENYGTVCSYISTNRHFIEEVSAIPNQEDEVEESEPAEELFTFAFDRDEVIDLLSSDVDREIKNRLFTEVLSTNPE